MRLLKGQTLNALHLKKLDLKNNDIKKLREDVVKIANYENLKKELHKFTKEISQMNLYERLSPQNQDRLRDLETRFQRIIDNVIRAQQNFEKEINRSLDKFKKTRADVSETLEVLKKRAMEQLDSADVIIKRREKPAAPATGVGKAKGKTASAPRKAGKGKNKTAN